MLAESTQRTSLATSQLPCHNFFGYLDLAMTVFYGWMEYQLLLLPAVYD
jgi:hypothetical protein